MNPEDRARRVMKLEGRRIDKLVRSAANLASASVPSLDRRDEIIGIADRLSRTITPHTACARGCSECCHMSTTLSGYEAGKIGRFLGREPRRLGRKVGANPGLAEELRKRFTGMPCPFLERGRCTVYPVRPIACRIHHTMMDDESSCRMRLNEDGTAANPTPALNLGTVGTASSAIFAGDDFGDIREFFPADGEP